MPAHASSSRKLVTSALLWPIQTHNGAVLCGQLTGPDSDGDPSYCWTSLIRTPDGPADISEFSPAGLMSLIIGHMQAFHGF